ncbi:MAG: phosphatidylglycerol lysyltransferase domain-containing protein, partial [Syntrophales bacterium]|nr:phosphatidylglycerol lysyltransferase domain-containing protein [Syntrophales bacterium]
ACEKEAVTHALNSIEDMEWRSLWVRIDGQISAFVIVSHLTVDLGVMNFEKAYTHIRGLYQYLDNIGAQQLFDGYKYINKESDMGIAALAASKKSYYPIKKLKSFCLKIKD